MGDVDNNNKIDIVDALKIAQYATGIIPSPFNKAAADVNVNGMVDMVDALYVAQYSTELIPYFPCSAYKRLPVPNIKQKAAEMCGAACGMMYLQYKKYTYGATEYAIPSQNEIYNLMRTNDPPTGGVPGVTSTGLYRTLKSLLYKHTLITSRSYTRDYLLTNMTENDVTSLAAQIAFIKDYEPIIVLWRSEFGGHFVVMVGFDEDNYRVLYNDPDDGSFQTKKVADWIKLEFDPVSKTRLFVAERL